MKIGIFAKTFARPSLEATLDAVRAHDLACVQFNLACAGLPTLPDALDDSVIERIRGAVTARGIEMAAISGTFNMCHPDAAEPAQNLVRLRVLPGRPAAFGRRCKSLRTAASPWPLSPSWPTSSTRPPRAAACWMKCARRA